ncbi:MAG: cypemycin family RiPP [Microbacteriaceae bacterium]|nr:cypemycin family RiPP [Microbacteriaceae bacterium]
MSTATATISAPKSIEDAVNEIFCNVKPGFMESTNDPVMTTPALVPAAVVTVIGSTLCLVC